MGPAAAPTLLDAPPPLAPQGKQARPFVLALWALALAALVFLIYLKSPVPTSFDSRWTVYSAVSYLKGESGSLDAFLDVDKLGGYGVETSSGHKRNFFPEGPTFIALPFVAIIEAVRPGFAASLNLGMAEFVEQIVASVVCAAACAFFFLAVSRRFGEMRFAAVMSLAFALGTPLWSTASRAMWQHGPVIACFCVGLWIVVEAVRRPNFIIALGAPLAIAVINRPTAALPALAVSLAVLAAYPRRFIFYLLPPALIAGLWIAHNLSIWHSALPPYYQASRIGLDSFWIALLGNLASPGRGLLVFSPLVLFAVPAPFLKSLSAPDRWIVYGCWGLTLVHLVAVSLFPHWWGGDSFGPRMMSDVTPLLMFAAAFTIAALLSAHGAPRLAGLSLAGLATAVSIFINAQGALRRAPYFDWSLSPALIDEAPDRLWDWRDLQFTRGLPVLGAPIPPDAQKMPAAEFSFAQGGAGLSLLAPGAWYAPEAWGVWGHADRAEINIPRSVLPAAACYRLFVEAQVFRAKPDAIVPILVLIDGARAAEWRYQAPEITPRRSTPFRAPRPQPDGRLHVVFASPTAASPATSDPATGGRVLGVGLSRLTIQAAPCV